MTPPLLLVYVRKAFAGVPLNGVHGFSFRNGFLAFRKGVSLREGCALSCRFGRSSPRGSFVSGSSPAAVSGLDRLLGSVRRLWHVRLPLPFDPGSEAVPFQGVTFRSRRRSVVSLLVGICSVGLLLRKGASVVACLDVALGWAPSLAA